MLSEFYTLLCFTHYIFLFDQCFEKMAPIMLRSNLDEALPHTEKFWAKIPFRALAAFQALKTPKTAFREIVAKGFVNRAERDAKRRPKNRQWET
jgi:hypothetical protein